MSDPKIPAPSTEPVVTVLATPKGPPFSGTCFSDYIVFVDESGDHSLASVDPTYPVFVLALCVFHKQHYGETVIPAVERLKFRYFGHDNVVLHESDIRKQKGEFVFLSHLPTRLEFMHRLSSIMEASHFALITCVVDKARLCPRKEAGENPYHIALRCCLESLQEFLAREKQDHLPTHLIVECRGKKEDAELELEFRRICDGDNPCGRPLPFQMVFADKRANLTGLQLADLVARPVGLNFIRPSQVNLAFEVLKSKFYNTEGDQFAKMDLESPGMRIYPPTKRKAPVNPPRP